MKEILHYLKTFYFLGARGWLTQKYIPEYTKYHDAFERLSEEEKDVLWCVYIARLYERRIYCKMNNISVSKFYRIRNTALAKLDLMLN